VLVFDDGRVSEVYLLSIRWGYTLKEDCFENNEWFNDSDRVITFAFEEQDEAGLWVYCFILLLL